MVSSFLSLLTVLSCSEYRKISSTFWQSTSSFMPKNSPVSASASSTCTLCRAVKSSYRAAASLTISSKMARLLTK